MVLLKLMGYLSSALIRDINFSPVGNMSNTKFMYRQSKKEEMTTQLEKNKRRVSTFLNCVCMLITIDGIS